MGEGAGDPAGGRDRERAVGRALAAWRAFRRAMAELRRCEGRRGAWPRILRLPDDRKGAGDG